MQDLNKGEKRIIRVYAGRDNDRKYLLYGWHKPDALLNEYNYDLRIIAHAIFLIIATLLGRKYYNPPLEI